MKKRVLYYLPILSLFLTPLLSAAPFDFDNAQYQVSRIIDSMLGIASPFFEMIIGDYSSSEFFFTKVLFLILLIIICKNVLDRTPLGEDNKKLSFLISTIISILAIRFMSENEFIEAIVIQYGTLGIAITTILPMVIFFYFVHNTRVGTFGRKMFWAIYTIILSALWLSKANEIPETANWIYGITITAAVLFIILDKSIHGYFGLADLKRFEKRENREAINRAKERILKLNERRGNGIISEYEWRQGIVQEEKLIRDLSKE
jgi:hypothetical protein